MNKPAGASKRRREVLRRYPGLTFVGVAAALALLLPSALNIPHSGPSTLSEYAPVAGDGDGQGDISQLGQAGNGGLGFGSSGRLSSQSGTAGFGSPSQRRPRLKRCVGNPPRQTEDPLSPPCVAFFEGDNFGATSRGVSREEIRVAVLLPPLAGSGRPIGTMVDYGTPPGPGDSDLDILIKNYARYFNDRYQTYGRYVHLWGLYGAAQTEPDIVERRRAEAARIDNEVKPYGTISLTFHTILPYVEEANARGILAVTIDAFERARYADSSPLLWGVFPDLEDEAGIAASYICRKLADRPAKHSGNVTDINAKRKFGIVYSQSASEPEFVKLASLLEKDLRSRCGVSVAEKAWASPDITQAQAEAPSQIAKLKAAEVTTVILIAKSQTILAFTSSASGTGWFPEWFIPGRRSFSGVDQAGNGRALPQEQWRRAFGVSFSSRWGDENQTHWVRSYQEVCPGCRPGGGYYMAAYVYDAMSLFFHGVQAAGPRLTPAQFDKGMHAIPRRSSLNSYTPAAYFGAGNFTYVKDAMEIWWDPSGQAPGAGGAAGCYRIPLEGKRFRADEWPEGDNNAFVNGPCNGDAPIT